MPSEVYYDGQGRRQSRKTTTGTEVETDIAVSKQSTTAGADLGGVAERKKSAPAPKEETDPSKMSELQRAAYNQKKKRTAAEAGDALAGRNKY